MIVKRKIDERREGGKRKAGRNAKGGEEEFQLRDGGIVAAFPFPTSQSLFNYDIRLRRELTVACGLWLCRPIVMIGSYALWFLGIR